MKLQPTDEASLLTNHNLLFAISFALPTAPLATTNKQGTEAININVCSESLFMFPRDH
jgi:hypothetical protein